MGRPLGIKWVRVCLPMVVPSFSRVMRVGIHYISSTVRRKLSKMTVRNPLSETN